MAFARLNKRDRKALAKATRKAEQNATPRFLVRTKLAENASDCEAAAADKLADAARAIRKGDDVDDVFSLVWDAILSLGEARGHRNAAYDLLEDGADFFGSP